MKITIRTWYVHSKTQEKELKQKRGKLEKLQQAAEETYTDCHFSNLKLEETKQKAIKERKQFEDEREQILNEIDKRKWTQINEELEQYKKNAKELPNIKEASGNDEGTVPSQEENKDPQENVIKRRTSRLKYVPEVVTLEKLEEQEISERRQLSEKELELEKIKNNIDKLKKETNMESIKDICESYQAYEETNANLSKKVQLLDEEVQISFNKQIQKLEKELSEIKKDINKQKAVGQLSSNKEAREEDEILTVYYNMMCRKKQRLKKY